jgi:hypothetical protein
MVISFEVEYEALMHEGARGFPATEQRTDIVVANSHVVDDEYVTQNSIGTFRVLNNDHWFV